MTRIQSFVAVALALAGLAGSPALLAQDLAMSAPPAASSGVATPARGMTMGQVEQKFGAPTEKYAAVGQPPITRWVYPDQVVYFEYEHVVHAVVVRR